MTRPSVDRDGMCNELENDSRQEKQEMKKKISTLVENGLMDKQEWDERRQKTKRWKKVTKWIETKAKSESKASATFKRSEMDN